MKNKSGSGNCEQISLNVGFDMAETLKSVTTELEMAILTIVLWHIGVENKISRKELVDQIHSQGFDQDERVIRLAISELRLKGIPVAGTGGINGGYWILKDGAEKDAYVQVQLKDPGENLLAQASAIEKSFNRWYPNGQLSLSQAQQQ